MIDFFSCITENLIDEDFYIRDDENQKPVYIVHSFGGQRLSEDEGKPIKCAKVNNDLKKEVGFIPVDNNDNLKLLRNDGNYDFRCDGMLCTKDRITFVEIKDAKKNKSAQLKHAKEQIISTITHFDKNHPSNKHKRQAYICDIYKENYSISNIVEPSSHEEKESFFSTYKTRLFYGAVIFV